MTHTELETALKNTYGEAVSINLVSPLHDEDFDAAYMVCIDDIMVCRADTPLKTICDAIETIQNFNTCARP